MLSPRYPLPAGASFLLSVGLGRSVSPAASVAAAAPAASGPPSIGDEMSVAGPVVPHHPPAAPWAAVAAAGGSDGDDDPALPRQRLKSTHEADLEPVRGPGSLRFACKPCRLAFASQESVKAHHGNRSDVFFTMHLDPRYEQILVETFTLAQAAAIVRAARGPDA